MLQYNTMQVFDEVESIVASVLEGYRVCVFAYGQTGSGKTFTMEGAKNDRYGMVWYAVQCLESSVSTQG